MVTKSSFRSITVGRVLFVRWISSPSGADGERLTRIARELHEKSGPIVYVSFVGRGSMSVSMHRAKNPPESAAMPMAIRALASESHLVVEARGLLGLAARAGLSGLAAVAKSNRLRVHARAEDVIDHLVEHHQMDRDEVRRALGALVFGTD